MLVKSPTLISRLLMLDPSRTLSSPFFLYFEATSEIHSRCPSSILLNTLLVSSPTLSFLRETGERHPQLQLVVLDDWGQRQYACPQTDNVAMVIETTGQQGIASSRNIIIQYRASEHGVLQRISSLHQDYDLLVYVLFTPSEKGLGWHFCIPCHQHNTSCRENVTTREYYAYRLHFRVRLGIYPSSDALLHPESLLGGWEQNVQDILHLGGRRF
ncbi:hypothetical protein QOT17_012035 [Balamuthia mandrillaris]